MASSRLRNILSAIGLFNAADCLLTLHLLQYGFVEGNPLMASVVETPWFVLIKIVLVPAALYFVWIVRDRVGKVASAALWVCAGIYTGLMGYLFVLVGLAPVL